MKGATSLVNVLVMGFFLLFAVSFISLAIAFFLSAKIGIVSSGFFIVGGFYLLLFLAVRFYFREKIEEFLLVKFSRKVFNEAPDEEREILNKELDDETI